MKSVLGAAALALGTSIAAVVPAAAQVIVDASDPQKLAELVRGYGSATLDVDAVGDPKINGRIEGTAFSIYFFGCEENRNCDTVLFKAIWTKTGASESDLNAWNREKLFGRAYVDEDGDSVLEMAVNLKFGVTVENFDDTVDWWRVAIQSLEETLQ